MQTWALIVDSFREARDTKIFWVMTMISLIVVAAMACIGIYPDRVDFFFGAWEMTTDKFAAPAGVSPHLLASLGVDGRLVAALMIDGVLDLVLGFIGMILALIATASFIPNMTARGAIDVLLSKPIPRWRLFLGRYLGAMAFIFVQACIFVVLSFLVMGFRWKVWLPGYLLTIPLLVLLFSYLYCLSACVGVVFGSTVAAVLLTLGGWVLFFGVQTVDDLFRTTPELQKYTRVQAVFNAARWAVPKTQDITYIAKRWTGASSAARWVPKTEDPDTQRAIAEADRLEQERIRIHPLHTIGSSLLFEAVVVAAAMWSFSRRDY